MKGAGSRKKEKRNILSVGKVEGEGRKGGRLNNEEKKEEEEGRE